MGFPLSATTEVPDEHLFSDLFQTLKTHIHACITKLTTRHATILRQQGKSHSGTISESNPPTGEAERCPFLDPFLVTASESPAGSTASSGKYTASGIPSRSLPYFIRERAEACS
tara:strand:- start:369 stop:710 length:342 start_codon:yes stop_codon:yes gene_type:complete